MTADLGQPVDHPQDARQLVAVLDHGEPGVLARPVEVGQPDDDAPGFLPVVRDDVPRHHPAPQAEPLQGKVGPHREQPQGDFLHHVVQRVGVHPPGELAAQPRLDRGPGVSEETLGPGPYSASRYLTAFTDAAAELWECVVASAA